MKNWKLISATLLFGSIAFLSACNKGSRRPPIVGGMGKCPAETGGLPLTCCDASGIQTKFEAECDMMNPDRKPMEQAMEGTAGALAPTQAALGNAQRLLSNSSAIGAGGAPVLAEALAGGVKGQSAIGDRTGGGSPGATKTGGSPDAGGRGSRGSGGMGSMGGGSGLSGLTQGKTGAGDAAFVPQGAVSLMGSGDESAAAQAGGGAAKGGADPYDPARFAMRDPGAGLSADGMSGQSGEMELGKEGGDADRVLASADPDDYFTRIDLNSNLFRDVEKRYRDQALRWASDSVAKPLKAR